jgi:perosamine synthetase
VITEAEAVPGAMREQVGPAALIQRRDRGPVYLAALDAGAKRVDARLLRRQHRLVPLALAEALGATYKGRAAGTFGVMGVFSFNGNKIITTGGGGMIVCASARLAARTRYLTTQAKDDPVEYVHDDIGYNFRMSNVLAAIGVAQLERLERRIAVKKANYERYRKGIAAIEGLSFLGIRPGTRPNYWFYSLLIDKKRYGMGRRELMKRLLAQAIETRPVWQLNHLQKPYRSKQAYRITEAPRLRERMLNLPCSPDLGAEEVGRVVAQLKKARG